MRLMSKDGNYPADALEWAKIYVRKGGLTPGIEPKPGEALDANTEVVEFGLLPASGYQVEESRVQIKTETNDITQTIQTLAQHVKAARGLSDAAGEPITQVDADVIRGLPDWMLFKLVKQLSLVRIVVGEREKN